MKKSHEQKDGLSLREEEKEPRKIVKGLVHGFLQFYHVIYLMILKHSGPLAPTRPPVPSGETLFWLAKYIGAFETMRFFVQDDNLPVAFLKIDEAFSDLQNSPQSCEANDFFIEVFGAQEVFDAFIELMRTPKGLYMRFDEGIEALVARFPDFAKHIKGPS